MAGRRLHPNPAATQPITEIVDPQLAQPLTPPMLTPEHVLAQQMASQNMAGTPLAPGGNPLPEEEPFAVFHGEEQAPSAPANETELTPDERAEFAMLMHVGRRSKTITVYTHPVVIESLCVGDDLLIGLYCKDYQGAAPADSRAYQIAVCAAGTRAVDGQPLYQPLSTEESEEEIFRKKIEKLKSWYPPTITEVYRGIMNLDREFAELSEKLTKRKG